ncbi:Glycerol-3-phosphate dehydrogenase [NAD(P)+] [Dissulfuribacter thermophilus]|uniref:Glycerol-3-phosphate dehydrogenase [NAD(P)+] n=1 Tax=Dissulfuribacter thermophilus TaxID=1156395 RepID=A0A1B9F7A8_9BACT|nr:NAD(P)H-dependent glycerol-3-phosphate dehydrogenase [Dissulfuribacter thermophilus]OCC15734.1 Glycerol-3-phosphate dehydrogenase [NAD(P)+] [Dissulfuribacter thermophilus]
MMYSPKIAILGAGSWGTALAVHLGRAGRDCVLWGRDPLLLEQIGMLRENPKYLPGISIPENVQLTSSLKEAVSKRDIILIVVPSHGFRSIVTELNNLMCKTDKENAAFVSCTKGVENGTLYFMTEVIEDVLGIEVSKKVAVLSGPSFAKEVAQGLPTAVTVASKDSTLAAQLQDVFSYGTFRVYTTDDVRGVEVGGAVKNVLAIAVGISDGMGLGLNARAALITRGLREIVRLGMNLGASPLTFAGLSGLGDLVLTCTGDLSRNRQVGLRLGKGEDINSILSSMNMVAEGVKTSRALYDLGVRTQTDMPISMAVYQVLYEGIKPDEAVTSLIERPLRPEWE